MNWPSDERRGDNRLTPIIDASPAVRKYIRERGGRLFVWPEDVSGSFATEKVSTSAPASRREFEEYDAGDFTLFLQSDFEPPKIKLRLRRWWPLAPISVSTGFELGDVAGQSGTGGT